MAVPLDAAMPKGLELGPGFTIRVTALSTTDGSVVPGVTVSNLSVLARASSVIPDAGTPTPAPAPTPTPPPTPPPPPAPQPSGGYAQRVGALSYGGNMTTTLAAATTYAEFQSGLSALQPGQILPVHGVTFPQEPVLVKQLSAAARVTFDAACKFQGGGLRLPALWVKDVTNVQLVFQGTRIASPNGPGILVTGFRSSVLDGFVLDGCGMSGINVFPEYPDGITDSFIRGEGTRIALRPDLDNHTDKGTGFHVCNLSDVTTPYLMQGCTVAIYGHDSAGGSVLEYGNPQTLNQPHDNTLYVKGYNMTQVAVTQVAGNGLNLWGHIGSVTVAYVEVDKMAGRAVESSPSGTWTNVRVEAGTATNTRLSPWAKAGPIQYGSVFPAP